MPHASHEQTINTALGEVLRRFGHHWRVQAEPVGGVFDSGGRPDVLIEEPGGWPIVIEAEVGNHRQAETEAQARLGQYLLLSPKTIDSAVALVYPESLRLHSGSELRETLLGIELEYAVFSREADGQVSRFPPSGWMQGGVRELALLARRLSVPVSRVDALATALETGVNRAEGAFSQTHPHGSAIGAEVATVFGQHDDEAGQTRRMAMTVITNALVFHSALAEAELAVQDQRTGERRPVKPPTQFRSHGSFMPTPLRDEWNAILEVNYWPVFNTAGSVLDKLPPLIASQTLNSLWTTAEELIAGGVTRSHDLTGIVFQRLIADRKFLATFYTRPAAAALLAGIALPMCKPIMGVEWGDTQALSAVRMADFACGTGTLLSTAYQRLSLLNEVFGGEPKELHRQLMKHGLVGMDVLTAAVHLTAAMLAGSHPDTPFEGECLLTMPYGVHQWGRSVGSLDLLDAQVSLAFMDEAAKMAGGMGEQRVHDLVERIGHGHFHLVIMNPPFTRHGAREGARIDVHNPAFAAFETAEEKQDELAEHLKRLARGGCAHGHAGMASFFVELAHRKLAASGTMALVLPMSAMSGQAWEGVRALWRSQYRDIVVVSIAARGTHARSFSADTGMAECLAIAAKGEPGGGDSRASFVVLARQPHTTLEGDLIARAVSDAIAKREVRRLEDGPHGGTRIMLGNALYGEIVDCPLPAEGTWPVVGMISIALAQSAFQLSQGRLWIEGMPQCDIPTVAMASIGEIAGRVGQHHLDISGAEVKADGLPQGPFEVLPGCPPGTAYPSLWSHDARRERFLTILADSHCRVRDIGGRVPKRLLERAAARWTLATRAHYNTDLQFNSQALLVAMTAERSIGGRAWPSIVFEDRTHEFAFALWCNSSLGLLCHWWVANKTQNGRGSTPVTSIPLVPTLDTRCLTGAQHLAAQEAIEALSKLRFLPFDQIDEDPARAELDRRLVVDVLRLPETLVARGGPFELLRRQLAAEPQIHGGKKTRVVFAESGEVTRRRNDR